MNLLCRLGLHKWELKEASVITFAKEETSSSLDWIACKRCGRNRLVWAKHDRSA